MVRMTSSSNPLGPNASESLPNISISIVLSSFLWVSIRFIFLIYNKAVCCDNIHPAICLQLICEGIYLLHSRIKRHRVRFFPVFIGYLICKVLRKSHSFFCPATAFFTPSRISDITFPFALHHVAAPTPCFVSTVVMPGISSLA